MQTDCSSKMKCAFCDVTLCNLIAGGQYQFLGKLQPISPICNYKHPLSHEHFHIFYLNFFITTPSLLTQRPFNESNLLLGK